MSGKMSRNKGLNFEREIAKTFRKIFPNAERAIVGSSLDNAGVDIRGAGSLRIQAKRNKQYCPISKIEEVKLSDGIPLLVTKADFKRPVACLYLEDFIKIIEDIGVIYDGD